MDKDMTSASGGSARIEIRDAAMRLFGDQGVKATTMKQIACLADVSPALIVHHYESKEGLRRAVDEYVVSTLEALTDDSDAEIMRALAAPKSVGRAGGASPMSGGPWVALEGLAMTGYLRRLIVDGDSSGAEVFGRLHRAMVQLLKAWGEAGAVREGDDVELRAAVLLSYDLVTVLLREQLKQLLGSDPLGPDGIERWSAETMRLLAGDLFAEASLPSLPEADSGH